MKGLLFVIVGIMIGGILFSIPYVDSAIPPTKSWQSIATNDTDVSTNPAWANATKYNDNLWILTDGSILIEVIQYDDDPE